MRIYLLQSIAGVISYGREMPHFPGRLLAFLTTAGEAVLVTDFRQRQTVRRAAVVVASLINELTPLQQFPGTVPPFITYIKHGANVLVTLPHEIAGVSAAAAGITTTDTAATSSRHVTFIILEFVNFLCRLNF